MNKKLNMVLLGILIVSLMASTASAAFIDDHKARIGTMAAPTSNNGIAGCGGCHGNLGSPTTAGFCTGCHVYPVFKLSVAANPTSVPAGSSTSVSFNVAESNNVKNVQTPSNGATVTLSGAASGSGTTNTAGSAAITVNPASAGTITATASKTGFNSGTTAVTVTAPAPVLTTITVTPSTANLLVGATQTFAAAPKDQFGNAIAATITWTSSNTAVGTIDATGKFTAKAAGTTTVKAASGTVSATASVTVTAPAPVPALTTITVTPSTANLLVGVTQTFAAAPKDQFGNAIAATITWTSSNTAVGTIDATGKFTAVGAGTTTVKAASGTVSATASVTVTAPAPVPALTTITVTPSTANLLVGATQTFAAAPKDQFGNAIAATITWTSSNTAVGTIDATGKFTAKAAGTTTVKAASGTVSGTATVTVTAPAPSPTGTYTVTFEVTDSRGNPVKDAKVEMEGDLNEITINTNDAGKAIFTVVPGIYSYESDKDGYREIENSIKVAGDTTVRIVLVRGQDKEEHSKR